MKKWEVINTGIIPKLEYVTKLSFGEDGLNIDLISGAVKCLNESLVECCADGA